MAIKVGDKVWVARYDMRKVKKTCPVCFGKLEVTLIFGNGEKVKLPCDYCRHGIEPLGYTMFYEEVAEAELREITAINTTTDTLGTNREYRSGNTVLTQKDIFGTREEAQARSEQLAKKARQASETQAELVKGNKNKSYSWNAGYHMRCASEARKSIEYHERMAKICSQKGK